MDSEKIFKTCMIFLFVIFITIYVSQVSGYHEYELHKKVELTNEEISKFESDIKNNKNIDINEYTDNSIEDYSNSFSRLSSSFSEFTSKYIKKSINGVFKAISDLLS